eukprot:9179021-Pyramimonas_sp.AAC.1
MARLAARFSAAGHLCPAAPAMALGRRASTARAGGTERERAWPRQASPGAHAPPIATVQPK